MVSKRVQVRNQPSDKNQPTGTPEAVLAAEVNMKSMDWGILVDLRVFSTDNSWPYKSS